MTKYKIFIFGSRLTDNVTYYGRTGTRCAVTIAEVVCLAQYHLPKTNPPQAESNSEVSVS